MPATRRRPVRPGPALIARAAALVVSAAHIAGCDVSGDVTAEPRVAARVNGVIIDARGLARGAASPQATPTDAWQVALERTIDRELFAQQAEARQLDRDPAVLRELDAARRDVLARAWLSQVVANLPPPGRDEIEAFAAAHPALFSQRRVWRTTEIVLPRQPADWPNLERELAGVASIRDAIAILQARGIDLPIALNVRRASESIPLDALSRFAELQPRDVVIFRTPPAVVIAQVEAVRDEPLDRKSTEELVRTYLMNQRRAGLESREAARLRNYARIQYENGGRRMATAEPLHPVQQISGGTR